jgi:hypothetical protein
VRRAACGEAARPTPGNGNAVSNFFQHSQQPTANREQGRGGGGVATGAMLDARMVCYVLCAMCSNSHQGASPQFPGVLVGPLPVRKCHRMSPKEHMQLATNSALGWVVCWVLGT